MSDQKFLSKVHAWLGHNKIWFETIAATVFTLASILVASLQWQTAKRQEEISLRQIQPNFIIAVHPIFDAKEDSFTDDELLIKNFGGPPRGLHDESTTFLHITTLSNDGKKYSDRDIPLVGYYFAEAIASESVAGLLIKKTGYRNNEKMASLTRELRKVAATDGFICDVQLRLYVKLAYRDLFDQSHVEYFSVESAGTASPLPPSEGSKWVDGFDFVHGDGVILDTVTAQNVWDKLQPKRSEDPPATQAPALPLTSPTTPNAGERPTPGPTLNGTVAPEATPLSSPSSTPTTEMPAPTSTPHSRSRHHHHRS